MPVMRDDLGGGAIGLRRRFIRPLSSWKLEIPGRQELQEPILGLLQYAQGDTPFWFDGAGFGEETTPILFGIGDGSKTDFNLPHRHVFIASLVIYNNGSVYSGWTPLSMSSDGATCDAIRYDSGLGIGYHATAKYRRRIKCIVKVEDKITRQRIFRSSINSENIHNLSISLEEFLT